jgi:hypothetical protein
LRSRATALTEVASLDATDADVPTYASLGPVLDDCSVALVLAIGLHCP